MLELMKREGTRLPKRRGKKAAASNYYREIANVLLVLRAEWVVDGRIKPDEPFPLIELAPIVRRALKAGVIPLMGNDQDEEESVKHHTDALRAELKWHGINMPTQRGGAPTSPPPR